MDKLLFWLGIGAAQEGPGSNEVKPSRHPVISFVVGILLALLIAAGLFILLVSQQWAHAGRLHHFVLGTSREGPAVASTSKCLAQMNKSQDVG